MIRRSLLLQMLSAIILASLTVPLAMVGGGSLEQSTAVGIPLAFVYLASAVSVHGILFRAKKRLEHSRWAERGALVLALVGTALAGSIFSWRATLAVGMSAVLVACLHYLQPSAKQLKRVGLAVTAVQTLSVTLLVIQF